MTRQNVRVSAMTPRDPAVPSGEIRAAIYCRISLDKTGEGLGVERQEEACRKIAEAYGYSIGGRWTDNDVSATTGKRRPGFEAMLASKPDVIVVWALDRLVRLSRELIPILESGIRIHAVQGGTIDPRDPYGEMYATVITAMSQLEGRQRSARQRSAYRQRAQNGKPQWGFRPYGYNRDGSPREEEAVHVREAYAAVLEGESCMGVAARLNRQGVLKPDREVRKPDGTKVTRPGGRWHGRDISDLLKAARNAGLRTYHGEVVAKGNWAALVDETIYRAALAILSDPTRTTNPHGGNTPRGFLSGLARCGKCGSPLWIGSRIEGGPNDGEKSYWCSSPSHCLKVPMAWADSMIASALLVELHSKPTVEGQTDNREEALKLKAEREVVQAKMRELADAWSRDVVTFDQMTTASSGLRERVAEIESELASLQERVPITGMGRDPKGELFYLTKDGKRELTVATMHSLLRENFSEITMHPRGKGRRELRPELLECTSRATGEKVYGGQAPSQVIVTSQAVVIDGARHSIPEES